MYDRLENTVIKGGRLVKVTLRMEYRSKTPPGMESNFVCQERFMRCSVKDTDQGKASGITETLQKAKMVRKY